MSRDINPFGLRMQPELRAKIEQAAKASGRSMNSEIVARLEETFTTQDSPIAKQVAKLPIDIQELIEVLVDNIVARGEGLPLRRYGVPKDQNA